uniref:Peptidase A2 domain-containing protein n=1 Tax=Strongyloides stercoralis TaxID=6248 RepID=A0AAF5DRI1_STRER
IRKTYRGHPVYGANADIDLNKLFSTIRETCESVEKAGSVTAKKILPYLVVLGKEFTLLKKKSGPYGASSSNISGVLNETLETLQRSIQTSVAIKLKEFKDGDCRAFIKQLEDAYKDNDARLEALERLVKGTARMACSSEDNKEFDIYRVDLFENNKIVTKISIEGIPLMALLDTGSDVCLLSSKIYKTFKQCTIKTKLHKVTNMKVCDVQGNVLKLLGGITLKAYNVDIPFLVVEHTLNGYDAILGAKQLKRVKELKKKLI